MKARRSIEEAKDDLIRVGDIIDCCNRFVKIFKKEQMDIINKMVEMSPNEGLYNYLTHLHQQQKIYSDEIPFALCCIINDPIIKERSKNE